MDFEDILRLTIAQRKKLQVTDLLGLEANQIIQILKISEPNQYIQEVRQYMYQTLKEAKKKIELDKASKNLNDELNEINRPYNN